MTLLNRIEQAHKLWTVMLPHIPAPEPAWVGRWCAHSDAIIEHAIIRTSKKFSPARIGQIAPEVVWRYASGIVTNEARETSDRR